MLTKAVLTVLIHFGTILVRNPADTGESVTRVPTDDGPVEIPGKVDERRRLVR